MIKIYWRDRDKKTNGFLEVPSEHDEKWYKKKGFMGFSGHPCQSRQLALKDARQLIWADHVGLVPSRCDPVYGLIRRHKWFFNEFKNEFSFDHTSTWRKDGERFPVLTITEPYHPFSDTATQGVITIGDKELCWIDCGATTFGLWYPPSTHMVFIWNPERYNFDKELLTSAPTIIFNE
jgi:hypothetical protein